MYDLGVKGQGQICVKSFLPFQTRIPLSFFLLRVFILNTMFMIWAATWDFQQIGMCDQQSLRSACADAQSDQILCKSLEYSMTVKLLAKQHLEFLCLKWGCTGSTESTLVKMPHCWKSLVTAHKLITIKVSDYQYDNGIKGPGWSILLKEFKRLLTWTPLSFLTEGVHIWQNDCLLCVDSNIVFCLDAKVKVKYAYLQRKLLFRVCFFLADGVHIQSNYYLWLRIIDMTLE